MANAYWAAIFGPSAHEELDVDMDCEQAFDDGQGHKWFEFKAFMITHLMTDVAPMQGGRQISPK